jgi:hypothetical protein
VDGSAASRAREDREQREREPRRRGEADTAQALLFLFGRRFLLLDRVRIVVLFSGTKRKGGIPGCSLVARSAGASSRSRPRGILSQAGGPVSDHKPDDDYFAKLDAEKKEKLRAQLDAEKATQALEERRNLHYHHCGKCGAVMNTHAFRGTDIEICPECNAVLLDKGELELLAGKDQTNVLAGIVDLFRRSP